MTKAKTRSTGGSTESERPSHFENAERLSKEGNFLESIQEYKLSLEDYPENEAALFGMALAQAQAGLVQEAEQSYRAALKINPKLWEAETNLGMLLLKQQRFEDALPHFKRAQELNPQSFHTSLFTAKVLESLGRLPEARDQYQQALPLAHNAAEKLEVHLSMGQIYLKTRSWAEAEEHLAAAKQYQSDTTALDVELAQLYLQTGENDKCVALLQPLAERLPGNAEIQELLGRAYAKTGSLDKASGALELALAQQRDSRRRQSISFQLAQAYQELGQMEKAIQVLLPVAGSSADSKLHFHLATLQLQRRDLDAALQSFLRALQLDPNCADCHSNLGSIFMLQQKYPEAIQAFTQFKVARPEIAGTYFYLGIAFDKLNDVENAFAHYQKFIELDQGKSDKQSFQARERMKVLEKRIKKR
ncbi:MAG TPA: tetratricopeptide repeat protein [Terriglobia bacterium]|nr:tetratricopeptide repeat protein [Terriglobia bacterium]